ncbi:hypothetical protein SOPP22_12520 [Shewanella sp. OPT22]|nr:hypothetical protein SOPP22_12520 [Shewanella sp. OPT22]
MNIEEKIDLVLVLVSILTFIFTINALINIKANLFTGMIHSAIERLDKLDSLGQYDLMLEKVEHYINRYPNELSFKWRKARALYKVEKFELAKEAFLSIADSEPSCKEDAEQYIENINSKLNI